MKNLELKIFRGNTIYHKVPGYTGILRMFRWNSEKNTYDVPIRGKSYQAYRRILMEGKRVREAKMFMSIRDALIWQSERSMEPMHGSTSTNNFVDSKLETTLGDVVNLWKESSTTNTIGTNIYYEKQVALLSPLFKIAMNDLSPSDIDGLVEGWKKRTASKNRMSYDRELETLGFLIRWYIDNYDEAVRISPIKSRHWKASKLNKERKFKRSYMEEEEYELFLSTLKELGGPMWHALGQTQGRHFMRVSETAAMKWKNLNLIKRTYLVCEHAIWPRNKTNPSTIKPGTKSRAAHEPFSIALFSNVLGSLSSLQSEAKSELIFTEDGGLLEYRRIQHMYDSAFKKAGLPFSGTHILRHTGATLFQHYSDGDKLALQALGGWKTSRQPEHYAKILSSVGRTAIDKIESKGQLILLKTNCEAAT